MWKVSKYGVFLVHIFQYLDWIQENTDQNNSAFGHFPRSKNLNVCSNFWCISFTFSIILYGALIYLTAKKTMKFSIKDFLGNFDPAETLNGKFYFCAVYILLHNIWPSPFRSKLGISPVQRVHVGPLQSPSFKTPDVFPKASGVKFYFSSIFLKTLCQLTPTLTFDFTVTIISTSSDCNNFYDGRIRF